MLQKNAGRLPALPVFGFDMWVEGRKIRNGSGLGEEGLEDLGAVVENFADVGGDED